MDFWRDDVNHNQLVCNDRKLSPAFQFQDTQDWAGMKTRLLVWITAISDGWENKKYTIFYFLFKALILHIMIKYSPRSIIYLFWFLFNAYLKFLNSSSNFYKHKAVGILKAFTEFWNKK